MRSSPVTASSRGTSRRDRQPRREVDDHDGRLATRRRDALPHAGDAATVRRGPARGARRSRYLATAARRALRRASPRRSAMGLRDRRRADRGEPRLHQELDNIRAAVSWALDREDDDAGSPCGSSPASLGGERRRLRLGVTTWAERAIDAARRLAPAAAKRRAGGGELGGGLNRGDLDVASGSAEEALAEGIAAAARAPRPRHTDARLSAAHPGRSRWRPSRPPRRALRVLAAAGRDSLEDRVVLTTALAGWRFFAGDVDGARVMGAEGGRRWRDDWRIDDIASDGLFM